MFLLALAASFYADLHLAQAVLGSVAAVGPAAVNLRTAVNYVVLAETGVSSVAPSVITGSVAVSPIGGDGLTGFSLTLDPTGQFSTSSQVTGELFAASYTAPAPATLTTAIADMGTAYTDAIGRANPDFLNLNGGSIGGLILSPGLYAWGSAVSVDSDITIAGGATDTWIFQVTGTFEIATGVKMTLTGGALAQNVVWVVTGAITAGAGSQLAGVMLGKTGITMETGSAVQGRLLAQTLVTLQMVPISILPTVP
ncbi:antifreeze protein [Mycena rosella]|uniref:Antifreeze protein n=1 Tax=Mycena rosella TaxID=1033263 RepID=A0AAD7DBR1_MYCRO|nr:antifreeze protein [Mycena rosella]